MELTEDMLRRIANNIADLRLRVNLLQQMATRRGKNFPEFEKLVEQGRETPEYRQICDEIVEQLKGGH